MRLDLRRRTASRPERFRLLTNHCRPLDAETLRMTGAAGTIGTGRVARASPDGYTLSIGPGSSTHVINGAIYTLPYDVLNDFEPIALFSNIPHIIVANKAVPADDLKGLIGWLKANPDSASQGTSGVGSVGHIVGVFFQKETGTRFHFVPYRGLALAMQDLLAGRVDMMIERRS